MESVFVILILSFIANSCTVYYSDLPRYLRVPHTNESLAGLNLTPHRIDVMMRQQEKTRAFRFVFSLEDADPAPCRLRENETIYVYVDDPVIYAEERIHLHGSELQATIILLKAYQQNQDPKFIINLCRLHLTGGVFNAVFDRFCDRIPEYIEGRHHLEPTDWGALQGDDVRTDNLVIKAIHDRRVREEQMNDTGNATVLTAEFFSDISNTVWSYVDSARNYGLRAIDALEHAIGATPLERDFVTVDMYYIVRGVALNPAAFIQHMRAPRNYSVWEIWNNGMQHLSGSYRPYWDLARHKFNDFKFKMGRFLDTHTLDLGINWDRPRDPETSPGTYVVYNETCEVANETAIPGQNSGNVVKFYHYFSIVHFREMWDPANSTFLPESVNMTSEFRWWQPNDHIKWLQWRWTRLLRSPFLEGIFGTNEFHQVVENCTFGWPLFPDPNPPFLCSLTFYPLLPDYFTPNETAIIQSGNLDFCRPWRNIGDLLLGWIAYTTAQLSPVSTFLIADNRVLGSAFSWAYITVDGKIPLRITADLLPDFFEVCLLWKTLGFVLLFIVVISIVIILLVTFIQFFIFLYNQRLRNKVDGMEAEDNAEDEEQRREEAEEEEEEDQGVRMGPGFVIRQ